MSMNLEESLGKLEGELGKIIAKQIPLRDPSITIIHITPKHIEEIYRQITAMMKRFKEKNANWNYYFVNIEKELFEILKKMRYIEPPNFANSCERDELKKDMKNSIKTKLIEKIKEKISAIKQASKPDNPPSFLLLFNVHSSYDYIQTKDIIAQIINQKGILLLILYLQRDNLSTFEKEAYKQADYNVHTLYLA